MWCAVVCVQRGHRQERRLRPAARVGQSESGERRGEGVHLPGREEGMDRKAMPAFPGLGGLVCFSLGGLPLALSLPPAQEDAKVSSPPVPVWLQARVEAVSQKEGVPRPGHALSSSSSFHLICPAHAS